MFFESSIRTRLIALAVVMVIAAVCVAALAPTAMALVSGDDCMGPGCADQIACGRSGEPQATSGPSASVSLVAVAPSTAQGVVDVHDRIAPAPPPGANPASRPFAPSAPRSPPSA